MFDKQKKEYIRKFETLTERNITHGMPIPFDAVLSFLYHNVSGQDKVTHAFNTMASNVAASNDLEEEYEEGMKKLGESETLYNMLAGHQNVLDEISSSVWILRETDYGAYTKAYVKEHGGDFDELEPGFRGIASWLVSWAIIHFNRHINVVPTPQYGKLMESYYLAINSGTRDALTQKFFDAGAITKSTEN